MINAELDKIHKEDGLITVYVKFKTASGEVVEKNSVQGKTKAEIKEKIRPLLRRAREDHGKSETLKSLAAQAIDELNREEI